MTETIKMRTMETAYQAIKEMDPDTAITRWAIRQAVSGGYIPSKRVGKKYIFNLDTLLDYFFYSYSTAYNKLQTESDKVKFIDAVMKYAFFGEEPDLPEYLDSMFDLARPNIDQSVNNALQGAVNGRKGGAPIGNQNARKKSAEEQTTLGLNEFKVDKDKEKDMEYGTENNTVSIYTEDYAGRGNIDYTKITEHSRYQST